ncbi:LysR family transcriptional regulator [Microscilla marina]|uniref:Transcriptional Regulator, LysR family n=1 Tax=Microscilla marina ATCC 23134 TaxID=313606 RepID=A1ZLC1_MICM2|nr:LysR substrate-binding domain-containing protein [Microscilla marina]EAY28675.1 transcriptional Regulator, LysR family [Microscilla marina ATCC 23134]
MELKHVEYFFVLANELNFSQAAKKLHISQPPLSRHIKALEAELGTTLFYRNTQSVRLTKEGELFYEEAKALLSQVKGAVSKLKTIVKSAPTQVQIGFVRPAMLLFLPGLLKTFRQSHPHIQVNITEINYPETTKSMLLNNQLDAAFSHSASLCNDLVYHQVFSEQLKLVMLPNHPLANCQEISLGELKDEQFIFFPRKLSPTLYDLFISACFEQGNFHPNVWMEATPPLARVELVAQGMGVSLAAASLEQMFVGKVVFKNIVSTPWVQFPIDLVWNPHFQHQVIQVFVDFAKKYMANWQAT